MRIFCVIMALALMAGHGRAKSGEGAGGTVTRASRSDFTQTIQRHEAPVTGRGLTVMSRILRAPVTHCAPVAGVLAGMGKALEGLSEAAAGGK